MRNMKNNILAILTYCLVIFAVCVIFYYFLIWLELYNCEVMGGSFTIENDGILQKMICEVTTQEITVKTDCYRNGEMVDCEDLYQPNR
jgi:hypothetical protein